MSYTNPKFYKEDYLAFSKSLTKGFDTHYGNAMDYYDDKIKHVKNTKLIYMRKQIK